MSTNYHADDLNGPRNQTDGSLGQTDVSRCQVDTSNTLNIAEIGGISHSEGAGTYLGPGDAKHSVREMDGVGSHVDTSTWSTDIPSIQTDVLIPAITPDTISTCPTEAKQPDPLTMGANSCVNEMDRLRNHPRTLNMCMQMTTPANEAGNISMCPNNQKMPNPPISTTKQFPDKPNGHGNLPDTSNMATDIPSIGSNMKTAEHVSRNVRSHRNSLKTKNSPTGPTKWTPEESNGDGDHAEASNVCMDSHCTGNKMEMAADEVENVRKG